MSTAQARPVDQREALLVVRLGSLLSTQRLEHCRRVAELAEALARRWGVGPAPAREAGLLHDSCRENRADWPALMAAGGIVLPAWAAGDARLLHGALGAVLAAREFGLPEPWCRAIERHSFGGSQMTRQELVLFVADHACKGRRGPAVPRWRRLAFDDLEAATLEILTSLIARRLKTRRPVAPPSIEAWNDLLLTRRTVPG